MDLQKKAGKDGERTVSLVSLPPEPSATDAALPYELPLPQSGPSKSSGAAKLNGQARPNGRDAQSGPTKSNGTAPAIGAHRVRTYEELDGAEGRAVFFRPHRYAAADLAPLRGTVRVSLDGMTRECPVRDVSQNGVAFVCADDLSIRPRQRLHVALRFDLHEVYKGEVRVGSVRKENGATVVGVSFPDFLLDTEELLQLRTVRGWNVEDGGARAKDKAWCLAGGDRFKALVAELRLFLEDAKGQLTDLEEQLPWHVLHGPDNAARAALISRLRVEFVADTVRFSEEIDAAVRELPGGFRNAAARQWSVRHIHELLMQSPVLHRAYHKPFGYPGDYEVMKFIYAQAFEGASLFARAVGLALGTQTCASVAVRTRKDLVKRHIKALLARRAGSGAPIRILTIAAGPAQELVELLEEIDELTGSVEVVLFEQDKNALAHAWRRLSSSSEARFPGAVRLTFLHDSIKRLLRDAELFVPFGSFDLVYSCGLFDYLQRPTATVLMRRLAAATRPGCQLLVANMVDHPARWLMEHHLDWPLIYRTREELLEIGRQAVPDAQLRILEEESGVNPFVELVKP